MVPLSGVIRASLPASELASALDLGGAWDGLLRAAPKGANVGRYVHNLPPGVLIAFIPHIGVAHEVIATVTPIRGKLIPAFSISRADGHWRLEPHPIYARKFEENALVELERNDWLEAACFLIQGLRSPRLRWSEPDPAAWEIVSAWETWRQLGWAWPDCAEDLKGRLGHATPMIPNSLQIRCRRIGLVR